MCVTLSATAYQRHEEDIRGRPSTPSATALNRLGQTIDGVGGAGVGGGCMWLVDKDMLRILVPLAADVAANIYPNATRARTSSKLLSLC